MTAADSPRGRARQKVSVDRSTTTRPVHGYAPLREVETDSDGSVVYYALKGDLIKIGHSRLYRQRMRDLKVDEALAVEPGGYEIERRRHCQFRRDLAIEREWFYPSPDLMAHIATLVERYGPAPAWRGRPYQLKPKKPPAIEPARREASRQSLRDSVQAFPELAEVLRSVKWLD